MPAADRINLPVGLFPGAGVALTPQEKAALDRQEFLAYQRREREKAVAEREASSNRLRNGIFDFMEQRVGAGPEWSGRAASVATDWIPGLDDATGAEDTYQAAKAGDWKGTAISGVATGVGIVPLIGTPLSKGVKAIARGADDLAGVVRHADDIAPPPAARLLAEDAAAIAPTPAAAVDLSDAVPAPKAPKAPRRVATETPNIRNMQLGDALPLIRSEVHLIPKEGGGYIGAPQWVKTPEDLAKMRADIDAAVEAGVEGADWYDRARAANIEVTGGVEREGNWMGAQHALYSAQRDPGAETGHVMEDLNSAIASGGTPVRTNTGVQTAKTQAAYAAGDPAVLRRGRGKKGDPDFVGKLGKKTGQYEMKINPGNKKALGTGAGVNDLWHGRLFGYNQESTFGPQAHSFMDYETALAADRANQKGLGGMTNWSGAKVQAAPWVFSKGEGLYKKSPKKFLNAARAEAGLPELKGSAKQIAAGAPQPPEVVKRARQLAFDQANRTQADYLDKFTAYGTYESVPYAKSGHRPDLLNASMEERQAYHEAANWNTAPGGRDAIYSSMAVPGGGPAARVRPTTEGLGAYTPPGSDVMEQNPMSVARPMVGIRGEGMDPGSREMITAAESFRGLTGVQGATPVHKIITNAPAKEQTSFRVDLKRPITQEEQSKLLAISERHGFGPIADTTDGLTFSNYGYKEDAAGNVVEEIPLTKKQQAQLLAEVDAAIPGGVSKGYRVKVDSVYPSFEKELAGPQGTGAATQKMLAAMENPSGAAIEADPQGLINDVIGRQIVRDEGAKFTRKDVANLRHVIKNNPKEWRAALGAALKNGTVLPGLALPLLLYPGAGFPAELMPEEPDE